MYSVDRLNRQYEKLREAVEEPENVGPLEASVKSLQKEIGSVRQSNGSSSRGIPREQLVGRRNPRQRYHADSRCHLCFP